MGVKYKKHTMYGFGEALLGISEILGCDSVWVCMRQIQGSYSTTVFDGKDPFWNILASP